MRACVCVRVCSTTRVSGETGSPPIPMVMHVRARASVAVALTLARPLLTSARTQLAELHSKRANKNRRRLPANEKSARGGAGSLEMRPVGALAQGKLPPPPTFAPKVSKKKKKQKKQKK